MIAPKPREDLVIVGVGRFLGLVGYGAANGLYVASLQYGPLALLASVFTTLLVFNAIFARVLLGEALTRPKLMGCGTILAGVCFVVVGSPKDAEVDLDAVDVSRLVSKRATRGCFE